MGGCNTSSLPPSTPQLAGDKEGSVVVKGCMWATVSYQKPTGPMCSADCDVMSCLHMAELCNVEKKP